MNFFKSLLSEDPDPQYPENSQVSEPELPENQLQKDLDENDVVGDPDHHSAESSSGGSMWGFGGLIQTITTRSENVLDAYRRDLKEFGSGLKKETELFREVASRAVKELPASIEVAHGAIDGVIKSTAEIISHGKETLLSQSSDDFGPPETPERRGSGRYSRFEAQLYAIQNDVNTFCEEPEDVEEYNKWKLGFVLTEKIEEIEDLIGENGALEGMHKRLVLSNEVGHGTFWFRYFYRVDKLKQQESVRANLVRRAISIDDDDEELSWDVDDDDDDDDDDENEKESSDSKPKGDESTNKKELGDQKTEKTLEEERKPNVSVAEESGENKSNMEYKHVRSDLELKGDESGQKGSSDQNSNKNAEEKSVPNAGVAEESEENKSKVENVNKANVVSSGEGVSVSSDEKVKVKESSEINNEENKVVSEESSKVENAKKEVKSEGKSDQGGSGTGKESDVSVVSSQQSVPEEEEEDMGWDEIEDVDSSDEKKVATPSGSANRADLKKRLSAAEEEDEDLSWDIEDDD